MFPGQVEDKADPFVAIEARLDRISEQVGACLAEVLSWRKKDDDSHLSVPASESGRVAPPHMAAYAPKGRCLALSSPVFGSETAREEGYPSEAKTSEPEPTPRSVRSGRSGRSGSQNSPQIGRRPEHTVRNVDLKLAWQIRAKEAREDVSDEETQPMMRILYRSRLDQLWELLDDPNSSRAAWVISQSLKLIVIASVVITNFQTTEEITINSNLAAVMESVFDVIFLAEFLCRFLSAPSKRGYLLDPINFPDFVSALPFFWRASVGFVIIKSEPMDMTQVVLLFLLPLIRLLKLLRYFESFHLLIDACKNSAEALPVLTYVMAVITLFSATAIYLGEARSSIPSMQHSLWLAIVTMTTVGYGDFFPRSLAGYITVSFLTVLSVLFLALPVGIIGNEFTACWQKRARVLLITRARKCLAKWGYTAKDVKILFDFVDVNGDGQLDVVEFMELFHQMRIGIDMASAVDLFELFDDDQSGSIDCQEFLRHVFPNDRPQNERKTEAIEMSRGRVSMALHRLEEIKQTVQ